MPSAAAPVATPSKSPCPIAPICIAAMRAAFWIRRLWDFHADALTPRNVSGRFARGRSARARKRGMPMSTTTGDLRPASTTVNWRTPLVVVICGCAIGLLSFGPRSSLGFFVQPMGREFAWGRDVFGLALALQNLLWGLGQPIAGAIADRFGVLRVVCVGALLYAGGLLLMRYA